VGTNVLRRYWDVLPPDGALRRGASRGAFHRRVVFSYAGTYTAPGHATVHTGVTPREHGVAANLVFDRKRRAVVPVVDDAEHGVLGHRGAFAAPRVLNVKTVADRLKEATAGDAKVASLSVKDRSAVLGGGQHPDLVLWYDKALGRYTTSTYYAEALPPWVAAWNDAHPVDTLLVPWEAGDPARLAEHAGADDAPGEGDWHGLGTTFPHDPGATAAPLSAVRATPQSSEHLLELAWETVKQLDLGEDATPDLLALSISSPDYVGHVFGPGSWEYLDNLLRVDRALGRLLAKLEERTDVAVLITSDHGAAPLPEGMPGEEPAGRLDPERIARALEAHLESELGKGPWVAAFSQPFVYLTEHARTPARRSHAVAEALDWLANRPEVAAAFDARDLASRTQPARDAMERAAKRSTPPDTEGDVFIVPARRFVVDEGMPPGKGTSHGTPWPHDRQVPVLFWGPGVTPRSTEDPLPMTSAAPTAARLLRIPFPSDTRPLPGAPGEPGEGSTSTASGATDGAFSGGRSR
ncbi:MAG: alkaline phosphatase family protein, partial [Myxococcota bacterium]